MDSNNTTLNTILQTVLELKQDIGSLNTHIENNNRQIKSIIDQHGQLATRVEVIDNQIKKARYTLTGGAGVISFLVAVAFKVFGSSG